MATYAVPRDPTAVVGRRIGAYIVDVLILLVVSVIMFFVQADSFDFGSSSAAADACEAVREDSSANICVNLGSTAYAVEDSDTFLVWGPSLALGLLNAVVLQGATGASIGKLAVGLRVVKKDTYQQASYGPNLVRWLLLIVDSAPWCFPLVGLITVLATKQHQRVGDMAAGTLVVGAADVGRPPEPAALGAWGATPPPASWPPAGPAAPPPPGAWGAGGPAAPTAPPPGMPPTDTGTAPPAPPIAESDWRPPGAAPEAVPAEPAGPPPVDESALGAPDATTPATGGAAAGGTEEAAMPGVGAPTWDDARNTYIQWDPELSAWMEWDDVKKVWVPISK